MWEVVCHYVHKHVHSDRQMWSHLFMLSVGNWLLPSIHWVSFICKCTLTCKMTIPEGGIYKFYVTLATPGREIWAIFSMWCISNWISSINCIRSLWTATVSGAYEGNSWTVYSCWYMKKINIKFGSIHKSICVQLWHIHVVC